MRNLRFAVVGTGFWANYQVPAWLSLQGVELVALVDKTKDKAEALAEKHNVRRIYTDVQQLLENEALDFVDIITDVDTHEFITTMVARKGVHVICQKPMGPSFDAAKEMVTVCAKNNVQFFVHENWRWQTPIREIKSLLDKNHIGEVFKSRVTFCSAFPVFENQPFLAELDQFIITDIGSHILDVCRFLFGEAETIMAHITTVNPGIKGEDVANILMKMKNGISCFVEMSYASILEKESFPETLILIEGELGSISLSHNYEIRITTRKGTSVVKAPPKLYPWVDPKYALVHSSILDCNRNILQALRGASKAETTGSDNLETVRLVYAAYASAERNGPIIIKDFK